MLYSALHLLLLHLYQFQTAQDRIPVEPKDTTKSLLARLDANDISIHVCTHALSKDAGISGFLSINVMQILNFDVNKLASNFKFAMIVPVCAMLSNCDGNTSFVPRLPASWKTRDKASGTLLY